MASHGDSDDVANNGAYKMIRTSQKTNILLPRGDFIVQTWKAKAGSIVRTGQTIAVAAKQSSVVPSPAVAEAVVTAAAATAAAAPTTAAAHKRPKKRSRIVVPTTAQTANNHDTASSHFHPTAPSWAGGSTTPLTGKSIAERFTKPKFPELPSTSNITQKSLPATTTTMTANAADANSGEDSAAATIPILAPANGLLRCGCLNPDVDNVSIDGLPVIGYIEECLHPGVLGGLCIVCGEDIKEQTSGYNNNNSNNSSADDATGAASMSSPTSYSSLNEASSFLSSSSSNPQDNTNAKAYQQQQRRHDIRVTVSGGITMTVSESEGRHMAEQASRRLRTLKKLSLVLDLDHTLVHATPDHRARLYATHQNPDVRTLMLPMTEGGGGFGTSMATSNYQSGGAGGGGPSMRLGMQHFVKLRPYIKDFFQMVQPLYEVSVYTAGTRQYAEEITIVLSRHMVGATMDLVELEHLRYTVHRASAEYEKYDAHLLQQQEQQEKEQQRKRKRMSDSNQTSEEMNVKRNRIESSNEIDETSKTNGVNKHDVEIEIGTIKEEHKLNEDNDKDVGNAKKTAKKAVSFGPPPINATTDGDPKQQNGEHPPADSEDYAINNNNNPSVRSPSISKEQLERLQHDLEEAERLEAEAWELRQKIFGSRVVSRTDVGDLGQNVKSLKRIFPCGGTMAAVVDDREDVWANATDNTATTKKGEPPANLLLVKPYHWKPFLEFAEVNNSAKFIDVSDGTTGGSEEDDRESDRQLIWTGQTLQKLHERYYGCGFAATTGADKAERNPDIDTQWRTVPEVLTDMRREVLRGTKLVLSGLVPLHKKTLDANAPRPPIVRYAIALGCEVSIRFLPTFDCGGSIVNFYFLLNPKRFISCFKCIARKLALMALQLSETVAPGVTHVVAAKDGSDKAIQARKIAGCVLVKASWLVESYVSMLRCDVKQHLMGSKAEIESMMQRVAQHENMLKQLHEEQQPLNKSKVDNTTIGGDRTDSDDEEDDDDLAAELERELMNL
jgi:hypothetical protein